MNFKYRTRSICFSLFVAGAAMGVFMPSANATPISTDTWYQFGFGGNGTDLGDCPGCTPTIPVTPVAGTSPWTISLVAASTLTVLDLFLSIDQFEIFDGAVSLGATSAPVAGGACGGDIACALADARYSRGVFNLGPGNYSLTGVQLAGSAGAGVFRIETASTDVPLPASAYLVGVALTGLGLFRRRKCQA